MYTQVTAPAGLIDASFISEIGYGGLHDSDALTHFYGEDRRQFVDRFLDDSAKGKARADILVGTRRAGKTSILNHLLAKRKIRGGEEVRDFYINGQELFVGGAEVNAFYLTLGRALELRGKTDERFWRELHRKAEKNPVVLLIDEPFAIAVGDRYFFRKWRSLFDEGSRISLLYTSFIEDRVQARVESIKVAGTVSHSASLNVATRTTIHPFDDADIQEMMSDALFGERRDFAPNFIAFMKILTGGNPFLLVKMLQGFYGYWKQDRATPHLLSSARPFDPNILFNDHSLQEYFRMLGAFVLFNQENFGQVLEPVFQSRIGDASGGAYLDLTMGKFAAHRVLAIANHELLMREDRERLSWKAETDAEFRDLVAYLNDIGWLTVGINEEGNSQTTVGSFPLWAHYAERGGLPLRQAVEIYLGVS